MSIIVGVGVTCLFVGFIFGFVVCAVLSNSKMSDTPLMPLTEEELYGSLEIPPHAKFDKKA